MLNIFNKSEAMIPKVYYNIIYMNSDMFIFFFNFYNKHMLQKNENLQDLNESDSNHKALKIHIVVIKNVINWWNKE